jgi:intein/homing endonuclease
LHILWGCIEKNALVWLENGRPERISNICPGDKVLSENGTYQRVISVSHGKESILKYIEVNGRQLKMTQDHPVMTKEGWKQAKQLNDDDQILCMDNQYHPIQEITDIPYYDQVYNLYLENDSGFFANDIYVGDARKQNKMQDREYMSQEVIDEMKQLLKRENSEDGSKKCAGKNEILQH